jgi:dihydroorotate dehydrogenase
MLKFSNGHEFEFCVASGALAYDGNGWWFEQPWRWLGILRPREFTIITKTLTYLPREGNLKWWCPWRCVRLIPNGVVNSVGITNPGIDWWIKTIYPKIQRSQYNVIVSIAPEDEKQAGRMVDALNACSDIVGIELNVSCPNVDHDNGADYICMMAAKLKLILKLFVLID